MFNGGVLVIRCKKLEEVINFFLVFNQGQTFCGGFFLQNRFFWPEKFFFLVSALEKNTKVIFNLVWLSLLKSFSKLLNFCLQILKLCNQGVKSLSLLKAI